jgi:hypothetical protein
MRRYTYQHMYMINACFYYFSIFLSLPFLLHFRSIWSISCFIFPYISCLLYFGANTIWHSQFHFVCDKLPLSDISSLICYGRQTFTHCIKGGILYIKFYILIGSAGGCFALKLIIQKSEEFPQTFVDIIVIHKKRYS